MMSYTSAKYGLSKRHTNRCVLHHCKFLMSNKSWKDISYVRVSGHKSEASIKSYARKLCEEAVLFYKTCYFRHI